MLRLSSSLRDMGLPTHQPPPAADSTPTLNKSAINPRQEAARLVAQVVSSIPTALAPLVPVAVLCIGIYVTSIEAGGGRSVDRDHCSCDCWDGRFKGRHGAGGYKSVYFNLEPTTMFLMMWTALWLHLLGISMSRIRALFSIRRLSYAALVPGLLTFYPLFYGAWTVWNYYNDRFFIMLRSQLYFQITELISAFLIYQLLDRKSQSSASALSPTLGLAISASHVIIALKERVLWGLFMSGIQTVNGRDVMLMAGDVSCLIFFARLFVSSRLKPRAQLQLMFWGLSVTLCLVVTYILLLGYKFQ